MVVSRGASESRGRRLGTRRRRRERVSFSSVSRRRAAVRASGDARVRVGLRGDGAGSLSRRIDRRFLDGRPLGARARVGGAAVSGRRGRAGLGDEDGDDVRRRARGGASEHAVFWRRRRRRTAALDDARGDGGGARVGDSAVDGGGARGEAERLGHARDDAPPLRGALARRRRARAREDARRPRRGGGGDSPLGRVVGNRARRGDGDAVSRRPRRREEPGIVVERLGGRASGIARLPRRRGRG